MGSVEGTPVDMKPGRQRFLQTTGFGAQRSKHISLSDLKAHRFDDSLKTWLALDEVEFRVAGNRV
jgi:hypothetical protein